MNPVDETLQTLIIVLGLTSAASWAIAGSGSRLAPQASYRFAVANICIAMGVALAAQRTGANNFWFFHVADWLIIAGLVVFRSGIERLLHVGQSPWFWQVLPLVASIVGIAWVEPGPETYLVRGLTFCSVAAWMALDATRLCFAGMAAAEYPRRVAAMISAPFLLVGLVMLVRVVQISFLASEQQIIAEGPASDPSNAPFLWAMQLLMLVINLSLGALLITRLLLRIRKLAEHDHLTGCWNRRSLEERLRLEFDRNRRSGEHLSCLFLDIDHFKRVNDTLGHEAGDAALRHVGKVLGALVRKVDMVGRYGGEEFVIVLPATHLTGASEVAEKLRRALESSPVWFRDETFAVTASFGVATLTGAETIEQMLQRSDAAMYKAKEFGRNRVEVAV